MITNNVFKIKLEEKIAVLDLDDCLADSINYWVSWINKEFESQFKDLNQVKSFLSYSSYKELKRQYRESGDKINIPVKDKAKEFTDKLKKKGYKIVILTRRPLYLHSCLFKLTENWLKKNKINYDIILFEEKKHLKIFAELENLKLFIEDNLYIANTLGRFGVKTFLVDNIYNKGKTGKNVKRINNLMEVFKDGQI